MCSLWSSVGLGSNLDPHTGLWPGRFLVLTGPHLNRICILRMWKDRNRKSVPVPAKGYAGILQSYRHLHSIIRETWEGLPAHFHWKICIQGTRVLTGPLRSTSSNWSPVTEQLDHTYKLISLLNDLLLSSRIWIDCLLSFSSLNFSGCWSIVTHYAPGEKLAMSCQSG